MTHPLAAAPAAVGHVLALRGVLHSTPVTPTSFGHDAWWVIIAKVLVVFGLLVGITLLTIWGERRIVARMQQRLGPNRVGPMGVTQGLADGIKLMLKEDLIPALADKPVFLLAPILSAIPAFLAFSVVPFGPNVSVGGHHTPLQLTDLPVGLLFLLACSSLGVYGIVLAGWSSGSTYPLLGALRSAAQMISYEVSMGLSFVPVLLYSGSLSTSAIVASQGSRWYAWVLPISFIVYVVSAVGETNRAPFDLPEAETELVGGFHTEYSSIKFALFFLAEYINMVTVSAVATTLFLGGWRAPWPISLVGAFNTGWWPILWFLGKVVVFLFGFIWLRGTLPRLRYDQFMKLGWKVLIPLSLVWLLAVACIRTFQLHVGSSHRTPYILAAVVIALVVVGLLLLDPGAGRRHREEDLAAEDARRRAGDLQDIPLPPRPRGEPDVISSAGERVGAGTTGPRSDR